MKLPTTDKYDLTVAEVLSYIKESNVKTFIWYRLTLDDNDTIEVPKAYVVRNLDGHADELVLEACYYTSTQSIVLG